jgi:hypothetical protein
MAAEIRWYTSFANTTPVWKWITATGGDYTKLRFQTANANGVPSANPIPLPTAGTNYSAEKWCKVHVQVAAASHVDNLTLRSNKAGGIVAAGITMNYGFEATYATPSTATGTQSTKADTGAVGTTEIAWNAATASKTDTGTWGDFGVFQLAVGTTASGGVVADWIVYARYDEV